MSKNKTIVEVYNEDYLVLCNPVTFTKDTPPIPEWCPLEELEELW